MEIKKLQREVKQSISAADYRVLKQALSMICQGGMNQGSMLTARLHNLFFENAIEHPAQKEKNSEKFVISYANEDKECIRLEKKSKRKDFLLERNACISTHDCAKILAGEFDFLSGNEDPLLFEFYNGLQLNRIRPKILVDCTREMFTFGPGLICVILESDFSTGLNISDFLNEKHPIIKRTGQILLEVKYDRYLPEVVSRLLTGKKEPISALLPVRA